MTAFLAAFCWAYLQILIVFGYLLLGVSLCAGIIRLLEAGDP